MDQNSNELKAIFTRAEQRKNREKMKAKREEDAKRKIDIHRYILIGELFCQYFPGMMQIQPRRSKADNKAAFAEYENALRWLSEHTEFLNNMRNNPPNED